MAQKRTDALHTTQSTAQNYQVFSGRSVTRRGDCPSVTTPPRSPVIAPTGPQPDFALLNHLLLAILALETRLAPLLSDLADEKTRIMKLLKHRYYGDGPEVSQHREHSEYLESIDETKPLKIPKRPMKTDVSESKLSPDEDRWVRAGKRSTDAYELAPGLRTEVTARIAGPRGPISASTMAAIGQDPEHRSGMIIKETRVLFDEYEGTLHGLKQVVDGAPGLIQTFWWDVVLAWNAEKGHGSSKEKERERQKMHREL